MDREAGLPRTAWRMRNASHFLGPSRLGKLGILVKPFQREFRDRFELRYVNLARLVATSLCPGLLPNKRQLHRTVGKPIEREFTQLKPHLVQLFLTACPIKAV